jgi:hypothetical protein
MRKLILFGLTAILTLGAIGTWATATRGDRGQAAASLTTPISPLELMKAVRTSLPHEQYDAH